MSKRGCIVVCERCRILAAFEINGEIERKGFTRSRRVQREHLEIFHPRTLQLFPPLVINDPRQHWI